MLFSDAGNFWLRFVSFEKEKKSSLFYFFTLIVAVIVIIYVTSLRKPTLMFL